MTSLSRLLESISGLHYVATKVLAGDRGALPVLADAYEKDGNDLRFAQDFTKLFKPSI